MNIEDNGEFCIDYIENRYQKIHNMVHRHEILHLDPTVIKYLNEIKKLNDDMIVVSSAITDSSDVFKEKIKQLKDQEEIVNEPIKKLPGSVLDLVDI